MERSIIHLDMDAFYASIEQLDDPRLRGQPIIVGGKGRRGVVMTASYEARPYGVHSAIPMAQATKLCPHAIVVPPRHERYAELSQHIFGILRSFTPLVEPLSLDEAFLDVTASQSLFGAPREIALAIKRKIHRETHLTGSAGIAPNKFVSKIASDMDKPDGLVTVSSINILAFLHPLPVTKLWGVGKVAGTSLHTLGVRTIGDLYNVSRQSLVMHCGTLGNRLFELARGIDDLDVIPDHEAKSIGQEETFGVDITETEELTTVLLRQAQNVARRLRKHELGATTISTKVKLAEGAGGGKYPIHTRSRTLPSPTNDASQIFRIASKLLLAVPRPGGVRLIGIQTSNLESMQCTEQLDLFMPAAQTSTGRLKLGNALDDLSERYGNDIVRLGATRNKDVTIRHKRVVGNT